MKEIDPNLPIDKIAYQVVSKSSEKGAEFNSGHLLTSMSPLPVRQFLGNRNYNKIGIRFGRLTVIGLSASFWGSTGKGLRWVVKCKCGRYEIRTARVINKKDDRDKCVDCRKTEYLNSITV